MNVSDEFRQIAHCQKWPTLRVSNEVQHSQPNENLHVKNHEKLTKIRSTIVIHEFIYIVNESQKLPYLLAWSCIL